MDNLLYYQENLKKQQANLKELYKERKAVKKEWLKTQKKEVADRLTDLNIYISQTKSSIQTYKQYIEKEKCV